MHVRVLVLLVIAACGRIGFGETGDRGSNGDGGATDDGTAADGTTVTCVDGDGICAVACVGMDTDCMTTCGDGRCVGNAGERCGNCASDCATTNDVCGNTICDPDEDSTSCETDCGPSPWPFTQLETDLFNALNMLRTSGFQCPGTGSVTTAPALAAGPADPTDDAHHLAWQIAHQPNTSMMPMTCNGTSYAALTPPGYFTGVFTSGNATALAALNGFKSNNGDCVALMNPSSTMVEIGAAMDVTDGWIIFLN